MDYYVFRPFVSRGGGVIAGHPKASPEGWRWHEGEPLAAEYPADASVKFTANFPDARELRDFQPNILGGIIASPKAREVIAAVEVRGIETLPVAIRDHSGTVVAPDYAFLNPLGSQDAIDLRRSVLTMNALDKSQVLSVEKLVLAPERIDPDAKLFRCTTWMRLFLVRDDVKVAFEQAGLTGCRFFPAEGWDGLDI